MSLQDCKKLDKLNLVIQTFTPDDKCLVSSFDSGVFAFNNYISNEALTEKDEGDGVTYIILDEKSKTEKVLVAYYTISASTIHIKDNYDYSDDTIPEEEKRMHYSPISSFMINMFAVNKSYQNTIYNGKVVSDWILLNIIHELYEMSINVIGAKRILLCSVKDAVNFYTRNHFCKLTDSLTLFDKFVDDTIPMYLSLHDINNKEIV